MLTDGGPLRLDIPGDRDGSFAPILILKHERSFISAHLATSSAPLGAMLGEEATAGLNQLWRFTLEGMLVCAINPGLVLTANGDALALSAYTGDAGQQWQWGYAGSTALSAVGDSVPLPWGALQNQGSGNPVLVSARRRATEGRFRHCPGDWRIPLRWDFPRLALRDLRQ